jgi:hypothetical protein
MCSKGAIGRPVRPSGPPAGRSRLRLECTARALAEVYASSDAHEKCVRDFVVA